jgi:hypothetical protein
VNIVFNAPVATARPAPVCPSATPIASGITTAAALRNATRTGTSRGLSATNERSTSAPGQVSGITYFDGAGLKWPQCLQVRSSRDE